MRTEQRGAIKPSDAAGDTPDRFGFFAYLAVFGAGLGWSSWLMAASTGTPNQDEIAHVLIAKHVWNDPSLLLDAWGRPGNTIAFAIPARWGLTGARIGALVVSVLTVLVATRIAQHLGVKRLYLIPLLLWFQPWFHTYGHLALTETPFTLYLSCGLLAYLTKRYGLAAFWFGILPLTRWEALALLPLAAVYLIATKRWRPLAILVAPVAAYLALSPLSGGDVNTIGEYLAMRPGAYGYGELTHFFRTSAPLIGAPVLVLAAVGLPNLRDRRVFAVTIASAAYFLIQVATWYRGRGAGYAEFVMPVAPGLALLGAFGVERLLAFIRGGNEFAAAARILLVGAVAAAVMTIGFRSEPRLLDAEGRSMEAAAEWLRESRIRPPRILSTHAWFQYFYDIPLPTSHRGLPNGGRDQPTGTIMVWDRHYSDRWGYHLKDLLDPSNGWERLATFGGGRAAIFRKGTSPA